jgi:CheY-like chemotaxis protein
LANALSQAAPDIFDCSDADKRMPLILVVDDEPLVRLLIADTLIELGCTVEEAGSARETLLKFAVLRDALSAVVIDLGLPDRPGEELMRQLRAVRPGLPILLATGYTSSLLRERLADERLVELLAKPFEPRHLQAALLRLGIRLRNELPSG